MSPARLAVLQIPNSTREKTDCTSSPATPAVRDEVLLPSRPVSLPKLARDADSKVRRCYIGVLDSGATNQRIFLRKAVGAY